MPPFETLPSEKDYQIVGTIRDVMPGFLISAVIKNLHNENA